MFQTAVKIIVPAVIVIAFAGLVASKYDRAILSVKSPDEKYEVTFLDKPLALTPETKNAYLSIRKDGAEIVSEKLIYTGDILDSEFDELYPRWKWLSNSVLAIGNLNKDISDEVVVENKTPNAIDYMLVETYDDKFIVLSLQPGQQVSWEFRYGGRLSFEGESFAAKTIFAEAIEANGYLRPFRFHVVIEPTGAVLTLTNGQATKVNCGAVNRPRL